MLNEKVLLRENMEDFSKKTTMISFPACFHSPLPSFRINSWLTGSTARSSRQSLWGPEHLRYVNKVRWQKTQIHRSFLTENRKKSLGDNELTHAVQVNTPKTKSNVPTRIYFNKHTGVQCSSPTRKESLGFFSLSLHRTSQGPATRSDPLLNGREQHQTQSFRPWFMCL